MFSEQKCRVALLVLAILTPNTWLIGLGVIAIILTVLRLPILVWRNSQRGLVTQKLGQSSSILRSIPCARQRYASKRSFLKAQSIRRNLQRADQRNRRARKKSRVLRPRVARERFRKHREKEIDVKFAPCRECVGENEHDQDVHLGDEGESDRYPCGIPDWCGKPVGMKCTVNGGCRDHRFFGDFQLQQSQGQRSYRYKHDPPFDGDLPHTANSGAFVHSEQLGDESRAETNLSCSRDVGAIILEGVSEAAARQSSEAFASIDGGEILCDEHDQDVHLEDEGESDQHPLGSLLETDALGLEARLVSDRSFSLSAEHMFDANCPETTQDTNSDLILTEIERQALGEISICRGKVLRWSNQGKFWQLRASRYWSAMSQRAASCLDTSLVKR